MSKPATTERLTERLTECLFEHQAVQAWSQLQPERVEPERVEILKLRDKSAVYRLAGVGPDGSAVIAKKCYAPTAAVERKIYQELLPRLPLPAVRLLGFVSEPEGDYSWLFLEEAEGREYSVLSEADRALAGRWLATLHCAVQRVVPDACLPGREPSHYLHLLRSSRATVLKLVSNPVVPDEDLPALRAVAAWCDVIESHWGTLEDLSGSLPRTVVHGDLVIKNVRVRSTAESTALLVFDWEMAGWGVPATDLAQFAGRTVSPEFAAYVSVMEASGIHISTRAVRRVAECGRFFRLIDDIAWACQWVVDDTYLFLQKPISVLRSYGRRLAETLHVVGWTE
jgi:hypothetical protein